MKLKTKIGILEKLKRYERIDSLVDEYRYDLFKKIDEKERHIVWLNLTEDSNLYDSTAYYLHNAIVGGRLNPQDYINQIMSDIPKGPHQKQLIQKVNEHYDSLRERYEKLMNEIEERKKEMEKEYRGKK